MANVLDLRRRIRSVKNTRQITKAMKMVSAAKLRRAQERALRRPARTRRCSSNVLESLVRRTDLYNDQTGEIVHPLLVEREEKIGAADRHRRAIRASPEASTPISARLRRSFLKERTGPQGAEHRPRTRRQEGNRLIQKTISRRHLREAPKSITTTISRSHYDTIRHRAASRSKSPRNTPISFSRPTLKPSVTKMSNDIIARYERAEIDAVYLVYNEFKSVIQQRLVDRKAAPHPQVRCLKISPQPQR